MQSFNSAFYSQQTENEYRPKGGDAVEVTTAAVIAAGYAGTTLSGGR